MIGWATGDGIAGPSRLPQAGSQTPSLASSRGLPPLFSHHQQGSPSGRGAVGLDGTPGSLESPNGGDQRPDSRDEKDGKGTTKKKKLKDGPAGDPSPGGGDDKEKRTKTGRACDACRGKKIRCDILPANEWVVRDQPICKHCKQYHLECTFFLPITETRFKKRKQAEEAEAQKAKTLSPEPDANLPSGGRIEGPTSINFLLHTTVPAYAGEAFDLRHHHSWEVSEDGNGLIRVRAPPSTSGYADADPGDPTKAHNRLNKPVLSASMISLLVNSYFEHLAPLFPIILRAEFAAKQNPSPLLLYAICGLGATRRQFSREVFAGVRGVINGLLRSNDILSDARLEHVQALLLLSQVHDLHAQPTAATASASLIRMGTAIRMAQDLGLHRESNLRAKSAEEPAAVELRRRIWATCVILDRWYGAALGIPLLIDLLDCDVLLPAPYEIVLDADPSMWPINIHFVHLTERLKLAILVGRVLKTIYSPTGLKYTTDEQLVGLLADMRSWHANLPEELKFKGNSSSVYAGLIHLNYAALHFLFWRVFMRITYICPPHLSFGLESADWTRMAQWSREALEWLSHHDEVLDTLFVFPYTATSCALVQYHNWARRRDRDALESLKLVRETALRWEAEVQPDQMSIRRKTCETMTLLYEAALKTNPESISDEDERPRLVNPIPGVQPRAQVGKAVWVPDPHREGGGIWVAQDEQVPKSSGIRGKSVVLASELGSAGGTGGASQNGSANGFHGRSGPPSVYTGGSGSPMASSLPGSALPNLGFGGVSMRTGGTGPNSAGSHTSFADLQRGAGQNFHSASPMGTAAGSLPLPLPSLGLAAPQSQSQAQSQSQSQYQPMAVDTPGRFQPAQAAQDPNTLADQGVNPSAYPFRQDGRPSLLQNDSAGVQLSGMPFAQIQVAASNLNPNLHENLDRSANSVLPIPMEYNSQETMPSTNTGSDLVFLDFMPTNEFDFNGWDTWFGNVDRLQSGQESRQATIPQ